MKKIMIVRCLNYIDFYFFSQASACIHVLRNDS